jgi:hypothetical protein
MFCQVQRNCPGSESTHLLTEANSSTSKLSALNVSQDSPAAKAAAVTPCVSSVLGVVAVTVKWNSSRAIAGTTSKLKLDCRILKLTRDPWVYKVVWWPMHEL